MEISKKKLDEFKQIIREDYGQELSDKEAYRVANKVLTMFRIICQPQPEDFRDNHKQDA